MDWDNIADNELNVLQRLDDVNVVKYYAQFDFNVKTNDGKNKIKLAIITARFVLFLFFVNAI